MCTANMRPLLLILLIVATGAALHVIAGKDTLPGSSGTSAVVAVADTFRATPAVAKDTSQRARGLAALERADQLAAAGRADDAMAAYDRAATLLPEIDEWINLHAARAAAINGDTQVVAQRLGTVNPAIARDWGWSARVDAFENAGARSRAIAIADSAAAQFTGSNRAAANTRAGTLRLEAGDTDAARKSFRSALSASRTAYDAARALSEMPGLTPDDRLIIGRVYLRGGNIERAAAGIRAYLDAGHGTAVERHRLRLDLGRAYFRAGDYVNAERTLRAVAENAPAGLAAPALYDAARAQYRRGEVAQARTTLRTVATRFAGSGTAARAYYLLADLDEDDRRFDEAAANFQRAIRTGADSEEVGLSYMRLAGMHFSRGEHAAARDAFDAYVARYPSGRRADQAKYWSALARLELGDTAAAMERFAAVRRSDPMSYYAARAADQLDESYIAAFNLRAAPSVPALDSAALRGLARVDLLRDAGWAGPAAAEMQRTRTAFGNDREDRYALAEALNERGFTNDGISIGLELRRREPWNPRLLRIVYPFPYRDIVMRAARSHGIDPFLAAGLIRQESLFNPHALSPAGAIGLMQVMPPTGARIARRLGIPFTPDQLRDPHVNVTIGMQFLADMIAEYDGRLDAVLAAYNAGPARVERWKVFPEWSSADLFSERIPYEETRDYVKIVQRNARLYEALYSESPPTS